VKDNGDWWKVEARKVRKLQASYGARGSMAGYSCGGARVNWAGPLFAWLSACKLALSGIGSAHKAYLITTPLFYRKCSKLNI